MRPRNKGFRYSELIGAVGRKKSVLDYLIERYPHASAEEWKERILAGRVLLDDKPAMPSSILEAGQRLVWNRPPWKEPEAPVSFSVLHEDAHLLAVDKPAGLPVLPGGGFLENTLLASVRSRDSKAVPLHRLGRWTSGVVLFARTRRARISLSEAWRRGRVWKRYRALASGKPGEREFTVRTPIGPVPHPRLGSVYAADPEGRPATSRVSVLEERADSFLADVVIETGRPHQIRIHLAAAGHPLVGDPLYAAGGRPPHECTALPGDPGYALHAAELHVPHPETEAVVEVRSEPPEPLRVT